MRAVYRREASAWQRARRAHWDAVAASADRSKRWSRGYHERLAQLYRFLIPPGQRVLELGCGEGDLLAAVEPARGVGVDFSGADDRPRRRAPPAAVVRRRRRAQPPGQRRNVRLRHRIGPRERSLGRAGCPRATAARHRSAHSTDPQHLQPRVGMAAGRGAEGGTRASAAAAELADRRRRGRAAAAGRLGSHPDVAGHPVAHAHADRRAVAQQIRRQHLAVPAAGAHELHRRASAAAIRERKAARCRSSSRRRNEAGNISGDLRTDARHGQCDRARLRRRAFDRRHVARDRARDGRASRSGARSSTGKPALAKGTPSASGSPRPPATS